ncbi:MAG: hypothetical protein HZB31_07915 [Nitrospirae bacterium]|nr:hypothetical protein [Nitrospirota bacterium]
MKEIALFTDGSVDPRRRIGVGAYLAVPASFLKATSCPLDKAEIADRITLRRFEDT